jgi:hypothetical protein
VLAAEEQDSDPDMVQELVNVDDGAAEVYEWPREHARWPFCG